MKEHVVRIHRQSSDILLAGHLQAGGVASYAVCCTVLSDDVFHARLRVYPEAGESGHQMNVSVPVPHYQEKLRGGFSVQIRSTARGLGKACFRYPFSQSSDKLIMGGAIAVADKVGSTPDRQPATLPDQPWG